MAKKKVSFVLSAEPEDLGVMEYAFGQGEKRNNEKTGERAKTWRSPYAIFLYIVSAFLVFWFLYTVIADAVRGGVKTVLAHGVDFFALGVCLAIIFLSVFKGWAKFARFALRHNLVKSNERASVESSAEMMEETYENLEKEPPVFEVYENCVRATDGLAVKVFDRAHIGKITAHTSHGQCFFSIEADEECISQVVWLFDVKLPLRELKKLQAVFGDKLSVEPLGGSTDENKAGHNKWRENLDEVNWPGIIMGFITFAVGCGVLALHYYLAESIPVALGAFFILGGVLVFFTGLASVPAVKVFIIPLLFGGIFIAIPFQFCKLIAGEEVIAYTFASASNFFSSFNAMYCAAFFLAAIGGVAVISAFVGLVKYIKYGEE